MLGELHYIHALSASRAIFTPVLGSHGFLYWHVIERYQKQEKQRYLALGNVKVQEADYTQISLFACPMGARICVTGFISLRGNKGLAFTSLGIMNLYVSIAGNAAQKIATSTEMQSSPLTFNHA